MKFLANENFPFPSVKYLREHGIEVKSVAEDLSGISDKQVIESARDGNFIILTFDKDYGELIFRFGEANPPAVIFYRFKGTNPEFAGKFLEDLIRENKIQFEKTFTVIEEENIRQRQYLVTNKNFLNKEFRNNERVIIHFDNGSFASGTIQYQRNKTGEKVNFDGDIIFVKRDGYKGEIGVPREGVWLLLRE